MEVDYFVHFIVPNYLYYILFYVDYTFIKIKVKRVWVVLVCINLDNGFVESSSFVTWSIPTKACGAISYEVGFFTFKSIYKLLRAWLVTKFKQQFSPLHFFYEWQFLPDPTLMGRVWYALKLLNYPNYIYIYIFIYINILTISKP